QQQQQQQRAPSSVAAGAERAGGGGRAALAGWHSCAERKASTALRSSFDELAARAWVEQGVAQTALVHRVVRRTHTAPLAVSSTSHARCLCAASALPLCRCSARCSANAPPAAGSAFAARPPALRPRPRPCPRRPSLPH
ncbi:hypothetical protein SVAN01_12020, partial [Stagonosporopsis vannaccii]